MKIKGKKVRFEYIRSVNDKGQTKKIEIDISSLRKEDIKDLKDFEKLGEHYGKLMRHL